MFREIVRFVLVGLLGLVGCHGDLQPANQVMVFRDLPSTVQRMPAHFIIRSTFKGSIEFIESEIFHIDVDITAPNVDQLALVQHNYTDYKSSVLLQMYKSVPIPPDSPWKYILLVVGGGTVLIFLFTLIVVAWWNAYKRPLIKDTKIFNPGLLGAPSGNCLDNELYSSQAPLLDEKIGEGDKGQNGGHKMKKRKKKKATARSSNQEEYVSSEEDTLDRRPEATSPNRQQFAAGRSPQKDLPPAESDLVASSRHAHPSGMTLTGVRPEGMTELPDPSTLPPPPPELTGDKPVVSYIKMTGPDGAAQTDAKYKRKSAGGQYIPLSQSEGSGSDIEKQQHNQATLKIRRDDSSEGSSAPHMPDVVKSRNRNPEYPPPPYMHKNGGRYIPLTNSEVDSSDGEYNNMNKLSAHQIAAILGDGTGRNSPKFSHSNTDRPPTSTFGPPLPASVQAQSTLPMSQRQPTQTSELDQLELDSVGSSRSGGSSKSSGFKTQTGSSYTDSIRSDSERRNISDSDSAKSSSSASTFPRSQNKDSAYGSAKYFMTLGGGGGGRQNGHTSPATDSEGSSPRLVDEAYGTMGSNGSSTLRGSEYFPFHSTASTGSGSSSSVVTVIAADDPNNTFGRRRVARHPDGAPDDSVAAGSTFKRPAPGGGGGNTGGSTAGGGGGGGGGYPGGQKYLHMTVLSLLSVVCLVTGVYGSLMNETVVHIKVYAPSGFIRNGSEIYFSRGNDITVSTSAMKYHLNVVEFGVENAQILNPEFNKCTMTSCAQGCDPNTGKCICHRGYSISDGFHCEDVDECTKVERICDQNAQCFNTPGSYKCICNEGFYGDGETCNACDAPCRNGTYEVMPCSETLPKLCKECASSCIKEYYIGAPCDATHNTRCKACTPRCSQRKFEYTPCHDKQDRQCRDVVDLPDVRTSSNIIHEDRQKATPVLSYLLHQTQSTGPLTHMVELKRGNGFSVSINLKESNLAPLFQAVDHTESNDNGGFYGDSTITDQYCPFPVPEKYQLSLVLHQGVTTRAKYYNCNKKKREAEGGKCARETGYYLDPQEPCETYSQFGRLPGINPDGWSVLCTRPGTLSNTFGVSSELEDLSTMFIDRTVKCAEQRTNCDACTIMCARTMSNRQGSHRCNITGEDADNGESPRLQHCFSCCGKQDCSKICEVYHNSECELVRCVTGNLAEFVLSPVFSHRGTVFGCHVQPKPSYKIYDITYTVRYKGKPVNSRSLRAQKIYEGHHPDKAIDEHNFLKVYYGSEVKGEVDFIEGDSSMRSFSSGYYSDQGMRVTEMEVTTRTLSVRPRKPFGVSTEFWKRQDCDTNALSELLLATSNPPDSDPYRPDPQMSVEFVGSGVYRMFNRTTVPFIYFEVPSNKSILQPLFDNTTVKDDSTLKAEILRSEKMWTLMLKGEVEQCPGFFNVKVTDPAYPDQPLFVYDVGVRCPRIFTIDFRIPTSGPDNFAKRLRVEVTDTYRTINMMVFRPAPNMTEETYDAKVTYENKGEKEMTVFTPIIAVLCVVISFLGLLLLVGFVTEPAHPGHAPKKIIENKVHSQHLLFVVCYVTFRAAYSLAVTFTVLLLLIRFANRESVGTIMEFDRYVDTADNLQKSEVGKIQSFVMEELNRQNQLANQTKVLCEGKLQHLQNVLEQTKQQLRVEDTEERLVSQVALQYTRLMIVNLTNDIEKFKQEFTAYARKSVDRLTRSIVQTSSALQGNKWLAGAKVIYDVVQSKRAAQGQNTKPFMDWVGIQQEVERLSVDLALVNFPMPNLTEFLSLQVPKTNHRQSSVPSIDDVSLPRNQWYFQFEKTPNEDSSTAAMPKKSGKLDTSRIMSWTSLLVILIFVDIIWFLHRMAKSYSTAKMILYGVPYYIDCKKSPGDSRSPQRGQRGRQPQHSGRCLTFLKDLNLRIMKTEFIPKLVATATACCAIYLVLRVSAHLLTVKTLASVGYFDTLVAPMETSYRLAKTRIKTNAYRINKFEYPFYEELVNVRTKRYQLMLEMYRDLQRSNNILHDSEYCAWRKMLNPAEKCNCTTAKTVKLHFDGCELPPVTPQPYRKRDFSAQKDKLSASMVPYINSTRQIVMDTCHLVLIFISLLVLVDILGAVTWIYLKRFNLLRLKPLFEVEHCETYPETSQTCG